jgi:hypothetical protein
MQLVVGRVNRVAEIAKKAEITRKHVGELMRGVFKILLDFPDGLPVKEVSIGWSKLRAEAFVSEFRLGDANAVDITSWKARGTSKADVKGIEVCTLTPQVFGL